MAQFINTLATTNAYLRLIAEAQERLVFLLPFLKLHPRLQQQLDEAGKQRLDVLFVYSHGRLDEQEVAWLKERHHIRLRWCPRLHMRCCLSERAALVTSKGPYRIEPSQRYDMGFYLCREEEPQLFKSLQEDAYRIVGDSRAAAPTPYAPRPQAPRTDELLADWVIAERMKISLEAFYQLLIDGGYLVRRSRKLELTPKGHKVGGKATFSRRYGPYFVWPRDVS